MLIDRNNIDDLAKLNYEIHDQWFSVDDISFDHSSNEFRLLFGPEKGEPDRTLRIRGALTYQVEDTERVGTYDISGLCVQVKKWRIKIQGCIPIRIIVDVHPDFEIQVLGIEQEPQGEVKD